MIRLKLKNRDTVVEKVQWMYDVWEKDFDPWPTSVEAEVSDGLTPSEVDWLDKVIDWVYGSQNGEKHIKVNGKVWDLDEFRK